MSAKTETGPRTLTVAGAAEELHVSADTVLKWAKAGHFRTFVPPGAVLGGGKTGPKMLRILREDWDSFVLGHLVTGLASAEPSASVAPKPAAVRAAGTDGVSRRGKGRAK